MLRERRQSLLPHMLLLLAFLVAIAVATYEAWHEIGR